jgi:hypothetical protein
MTAHLAKFGQFVRRRARYSLRTLLLVMTVSCVLLGTWSVYVEPYRAQANAQGALEANQGLNSIRFVPADGPGWQRWLVETMLGEGHFNHVVMVEFPKGLATDDKLQKHVSRLIGLRELTADYGEITDRGLAALAGQRELEKLSLRYAAGITDAGLAHLSRLSKLQSMHLTGSDVSDASVGLLTNLKSLRGLYLRWTRVTHEGAATLRKKLPNCGIHVIPRAS